MAKQRKPRKLKKNVRKYAKPKQTDVQRAIANNQLIPDEDGNEPAASTDVQPGTPAKVDVLAARALVGEPLWHPQDVTVIASTIDTVNERGEEHLARRYAEPTRKHK